MKKIFNTILCACLLASCHAQEQEPKDSNKEKGINVKEIATKAIDLSESPKIEDRIQAANLIAYFPLLISKETEISVINRLADDPEPRVRMVALSAMKSLVDIALIKPFLPLAKKMESDVDEKVASEARATYAFMKEQNAIFEKQGVTEEQVRKNSFGGKIPDLY